MAGIASRSATSSARANQCIGKMRAKRAKRKGAVTRWGPVRLGVGVAEDEAAQDQEQVDAEVAGAEDRDAKAELEVVGDDP